MSFWINVVVKICKPLSKLDIPTRRKRRTEKRTQRNKWKIWHSPELEPRSPSFLVPMLLPLSNGCQWQNLNLYPYKLSDLIFTPLPSLHVDFFSICCYLVFFFHNLSSVDFIIKYSSSYNYMSFWINVFVHIFKPLSKLDLSTLRKGSTEERTQRNKWKIWHSLEFEPRSPAFQVPMP